MLEEVLRYLHNWFCSREEIRFGKYHIEAGYIDLPFLREEQYFRICGSALNDGIYQYPTFSLSDETFQGAIWPLKLPPALLSLVAEIEAWQEKYGDTAAGPYTSESFGGYSYSKSSGTTSDSDSNTTSWQDAFASRLSGWRKL